MVVPFSLALLLAVPAGLPDKGVFSSLDKDVQTALPSWVTTKDVSLAVDRENGVLTLFLSGEPVKAYPIKPICPNASLDCLGLREPDRKDLAKLFPGGNTLPLSQGPPMFRDTDGDGIAETVDILLGAKKTVLLRSDYKETAPKLSYPGGDVPSNLGVCTDVIVRALRNAGIDLQKEIFEDAGRAPSAYPSIPKRNANLDHRRVRNLTVYFKRHWRPVEKAQDLLPGDVILLDTFPNKPGADHIGIVSDTVGGSGLPLIINAWTNGYVTKEMDLLAFVPMVRAYRAPASAARLGALKAMNASETKGLTVPSSTRQIVLVETDAWTSSEGNMSLWEQVKQKRWKRRSQPTRVMIGAVGLGWGRGLHAPETAKSLGGPDKSEGDNRAPAGIFSLSEATGYDPSPPTGSKFPYRQASEGLECVDDAKSPDYNQLRTRKPGVPTTWESYERMRRSDDQYRLTVIVEHNRDPVVPSAGSCIFLHVWETPGLPSPGCTMMPFADMRRLLTWLHPSAHPVLVQLPSAILAKAAPVWGLEDYQP
jgi:uncharacterized protein YijF (DUF1287 family)/L,D-peptidoglycan transpeptidase YkuD (ErfK/YbiS/YcfS/YnhG family)